MAPRRFSPGTSSKIKCLSAEYNRNLSAVAVAMCSHSGMKNVDVKHVEQARDALAAVGMSLVPWHKRAHFKTSFGGVLFGGGFSVAQSVSLFKLASSIEFALSMGVIGVMCTSGLVLMGLGWWEHRW